MSKVRWKKRAEESFDIHEPIAIAGKKVLASLYAKMVEREAGTLKGEDIEELHQMRISTRQMRSVVRHLKTIYGKKRIKPIRNSLKTIANTLGNARDLDSFMDFLQECKKDVSEDVHPAIDHLLQDRRALRKEEQEHVKAEIRGEEYKNLKRMIRGLVENDSEEDLQSTPLEFAAPQILLSDFDTILMYTGKAHDCSLEELHRLRIESKHLRYMSEFFQPIYKSSMKEFSGNIKEIQSFLGRVQDKRRDIEFFENHDAEIRNDLPTEEVENAYEHLVTHFHKTQKKNLKNFYKFWDTFTKPKTIKKNRELIVNGVKMPILKKS